MRVLTTVEVNSIMSDLLAFKMSGDDVFHLHEVFDCLEAAGHTVPTEDQCRNIAAEAGRASDDWAKEFAYEIWRALTAFGGGESESVSIADALSGRWSW